MHQLPDHLGWGSAPLTAAIRVAQDQAEKVKERQRAHSFSWPVISFQPQPPSPNPPSEPAPPPDRGRYVKLYPDVALGMLSQGQAVAGRIWLLLQYMDETGAGWIAVEEARQRFTRKDSSLRICGWRQLRKLLARGEGLFWQRNNDRIWLRSTIKVAAALSVQRLTGHPVKLPLDTLLQGIGKVRAHFYASFHSGRNESMAGTAHSKPISRAALQEICQVSRRTQHRYEQQAAVRRQGNFAIGSQSSTEEIQEQAWLRGRAVFRFVDHAGKMGPKGINYTAWQLPNNYFGPHERQPKGRQKRMNRELADLFMKGMTGNGNEMVQDRQPGDRRYYDQGLSAAAGYNRAPNQDIFWRSRLRRSEHYQLWHVLPAK
jgi:hypothetical protein